MHFALALPGAALMAGEWWWWEILALIAGRLGKVSLAAHVGACSIAFIAYQVPSGLNVTTAFLVGREVGRKNAPQAKRFGVVAMSSSCVIFCAMAALFWILVPFLARIYSRNGQVLLILPTLIRILAVTLIPDGLQNVLGAIIRVAERQRVAVLLYFIQSVLILSLSLFFVYQWNLGVDGIWWACFCGVTCGLFAFGMLVWLAIDFRVQVRRVEIRTRRDSMSMNASLLSFT